MNPKVQTEKYKSIKLITLAVLLGIIYVYSYNNIINQVNIHQFNKVCPVPRQGGNSDLYSQYFEDYILSIVFKDVQKGSYIDVGANHPDYSSVTKYFYKKGWRGINIEPIPQAHQMFLNERPGDINLNIGASNRQNEMQFYRIFRKDSKRDVLSTFNKEIFLKTRKDGYNYESIKIPVTTLNQVLNMHPLKEISFINIDVEGHEKQVLEGLDLKKHRPAVFIIEATEPGTSIPSHETWELILLNNNYEFILFDGLNRYYLANDHRGKFINNFKKAYTCAQKANEIYGIINNPLIANDSLF